METLVRAREHGYLDAYVVENPYIPPERPARTVESIQQPCTDRPNRAIALVVVCSIVVQAQEATVPSR